MDNWVCGKSELIEGAGYGDYEVFRYECGPTVQHGANPYGVSHKVEHFQVKKGKEVLDTFATVDEAIIYAGGLFTKELNEKAKDNE